ncbi:MAG TPA: hypothetical protein VGC14_14450 [Rhizobium sp.]
MTDDIAVGYTIGLTSESFGVAKDDTDGDLQPLHRVSGWRHPAYPPLDIFDFWMQALIVFKRGGWNVGIALKSERTVLSSAGTFTWDLDRDRIWGDPILASILNLPNERMDAGITLLEYLSLIVPEDRPGLAKKMHNVILSGSSCCHSHRLSRDGADPVWVTVTGHYYRVQHGLPTLCSGTITQIPISAVGNQ